MNLRLFCKLTTSIGMGERVESFFLPNDNYSFWNRNFPYEKGDDSLIEFYGSHPFFIQQVKKQK